VDYTRGLLEAIGLQAERLRMVNMSSAMASQFAAAATEFTAEIEHLGPSPLRADRQAAPQPQNQAPAGPTPDP
jgi:coenzyme F420-reducing hydrogenase delta subunit